MCPNSSRPAAPPNAWCCASTSPDRKVAALFAGAGHACDKECRHFAGSFGGGRGRLLTSLHLLGEALNYSVFRPSGAPEGRTRTARRSRWLEEPAPDLIRGRATQVVSNLAWVGKVT